MGPDTGEKDVTMTTEHQKTIPIVFQESDGARPAAEEEATLGPREVFARAGRFVQHVPVDQLQQSLKDLTGTLAAILADLKAVGDFELSEVQVGVELTAQGGVNLIGNLSAGAKGAMQLTFKPPADDDGG